MCPFTILNFLQMESGLAGETQPVVWATAPSALPAFRLTFAPATILPPVQMARPALPMSRPRSMSTASRLRAKMYRAILLVAALDLVEVFVSLKMSKMSKMSKTSKMSEMRKTSKVG
jgi:hypothetical protein